MEAIEGIMTRRSVRKYKDKAVTAEIIDKILAAAMQAPSAMNEQPWEFIVIKDKEILNKIPSVSLWTGMAKKAALVIIVCINRKKENIVAKGFGALDCSAAAQNILLSAHALGLGGVWCAAYPEEKIMSKTRELLSIPSHVDPLCIIPIGYPDEKPKPEKRFKKERVHENKW